MAREILTHWHHAPQGSRGYRDSTYRYPGVPLAINLDERVGRHRIVYDEPAVCWQEGLPLGNGDLAAMAYQPAGQLCWGLTKSDVRDLRHPVVPRVDHPTFRRIFEAEKNHLLADQINEEEWDFRTTFPSFLPAGGLWLRQTSKGQLRIKRQTLNLYRAVHEIELTGGGRVRSFVYADANVLAVRLQGLRGATLEFQLDPEAVDSARDGSETESQRQLRNEVFRRVRRNTTTNESSVIIDYADGHRSMLVAQVRGADLRVDQPTDEFAVLNITEDTAEIFLTIVTSREAAFLPRRAALLLETAWQRGFDRLLYDHHNIWHERFGRSSIQLPESMRILEALWCFAIYTMASSSRGAYPSPLMSAWNLMLEQPYGGDYHNNINSQMCYWPLFAANQCDLVLPYIEHFWSILPEMEAETRRVWKVPGIKVPFASIGRGLDHWGVGYWRYELFVSAWLAQVAWWHYQFTGDRKTLSERGWELIKGIADFYVAYLEPDPDTGKLSLPLTKLCEDTMFNVTPSKRLVRDAGMDLTAVHGHLRDAVLAAEVLGHQADAQRYSRALAELKPIPQSDGEFAIAEGIPLDVPVSHPYQLCAIYPTHLVTQNGPEELLAVAQRSLANLWRCSSRVTIDQPDSGRLRWNDDLSMGWIGAARAWMGDGDGALDALLNGWVTSTLKTNGFLSEQSRAPQQRATMMWMQNQLCGLANGLNEMLLQSQDGIIHIFPALPSSWQDIGFVQLRARPGVLVSAMRSEGSTRWVTLLSREAADVVLVNPFAGDDGSEIVAIDPATPDVQQTLVPDDSGHLQVSLPAGRAVLLARADCLPVEQETDTPEAIDSAPWSFTGPIKICPDDVAPNKTWTSWWGKPSAAK